MDNNQQAEGFDSDRFLRRLERERRLKEIEQSFQNIAEEAKQKQEDIYSNVFTEKGQDETMANHSETDFSNMPQPPQVETQNSRGSILARVTDIITPNRSLKKTQPTFEMSPTGVGSFPEIGPIGVAKKGNSAYWKKDGPGLGSRMTNARVQDTILHSFFTVRANSKKFIFGILLFCFLVVLCVTLVDIRSPSADVHLSEEGWRQLRIIQPVLEAQNVDGKKFSDHKSAHFSSLVWLANEASENPKALIEDDDEARILLERFVMLVFYYSTTTPDTTQGGQGQQQGWKHDENWLTEGMSVCEWHGVVCTNTVLPNDDETEIEVITGIFLSNNRLSGVISDELSKLKNLKVLRLSNNSLEGQVPSSIGDMKKLETLQVGENYLTGEMPSSICSLKRDGKLTVLGSDCGGSGNDIECSCCTECTP
jgi:hypothetical protein